MKEHSKQLSKCGMMLQEQERMEKQVEYCQVQMMQAKPVTIVKKQAKSAGLENKSHLEEEA